MKEQEVHREVVIKPQEGFQMQFASSCVDVNFGGAGLGTREKFRSRSRSCRAINDRSGFSCCDYT